VSEATEDTRVGLIGKTIGRYRVTGELGRGGMATVYRAHDPQLGRDVAIKVMHGAFAGRGDLEARFRREARAVAAIKHDGIVNVFDFAPAAAGEPGYIVTEIVEGPTLRALVDRHRGRLLPEVGMLIAGRVASALGAAHARGIVHRDVKPDNVMFDLATAGGARVLLTDFGIAHMTEADTMTATGAIVGSPIYMSPEQARGQEIGPASDVFSLGVMLYHVTTGRPPFAGRDPLTAIAAILRGEFLRPSQVDAHVGPALEAVILRCLRRLPRERFPDGSAVETALGELTREVQKMLGVGDPGAALRLFLDDDPSRPLAPGEAQARPIAGSFAATVGPIVAEQAFQQARHHARRGELARALAETNRVFAYAPDHAGARSLLAGIARRRRAGRMLAAGLALAAVAAGAAGVQRWRAARRATMGTAAAPVGTAAKAPAILSPATPATTPVAGIGVRASAVPPPTTAPAATTGAAPTPLTATAVSPGTAVRHRGPVRPHIGSIAPTGHPAATATDTPNPDPAGAREPSHPPPSTGASTAPTPTPTPAPATAPPPPPGPAARPTVTASLVLRASQGFCSPSMDEHPALIHPSYDHVAPGVHRVFCTLPGGAKIFVADYDLRPGTRPNLVIVPGADGRPLLSPPE
jgi:serine/threonine-protein kinase